MCLRSVKLTTCVQISLLPTSLALEGRREPTRSYYVSSVPRQAADLFSTDKPKNISTTNMHTQAVLTTKIVRQSDQHLQKSKGRRCPVYVIVGIK